MKKAISIILISVILISGCMSEVKDTTFETHTPTNPSSETEELLVELETIYLPSIMSGVYNQYPTLDFPLLEYTIKNNGDEIITVTFISEIQDYTSQARNTETIEPHSSKIIKQTPLLKPDIFLTELKTANLYYKVIAKEEVIDEATIPIKLYATDTMVWGVEENGEYIDTSYLISAWVTSHTPEIDELVRIAIEYTPQRSFIGYQGTEEDVVYQVKAIYDALQNEYQFTYVSSTLSFGEKEEVTQKVRLPSDTLGLSSANCIDATVVMASALENIEINPYITLIPGHAFLCYDLNEEGSEISCVETTMIPTSSFEEAEQVGVETYNQEVEKGNFDTEVSTLLSIKELRAEGILPLE